MGERRTRGSGRLAPALWVRVFGALPLMVPMAMATACVTPAEFEKVRVKVVKLERNQAATPAGQERERMAELATEIERLSRELQSLQGRLEVAEHQSRRALEQSRAALAGSTAAAAARLEEKADAEAPALPAGQTSAEVKAYRAAYAAWRNDDYANCIEQFRNFLQAYPESVYVDDGAYWMADCYFKSGDFKTAVLRFDDVVVRHPDGNKAADALYRQGEALLRLGPNYAKAAGKAFERVVKEYPDSKRVPDARRQLDLLRAG